MNLYVLHFDFFHTAPTASVVFGVTMPHITYGPKTTINALAEAIKKAREYGRTDAVENGERQAQSGS